MTADPEQRSTDAATLLFIGVVVLLAAGLFVMAWLWDGAPSDWGAVAVLGAMAVLGRRLRAPDVGRSVAFSFTSIVLLATAPIAGATATGIVGLLSFMAAARRSPARKVVFNTACNAIIGITGAWTYLAFGTADLPHVAGLDLVLGVGLPLMLADVVQCLVNAALIALVQRVSAGVPLRSQFLELLGSMGWAYVGYGVIGFLFVVLWVPAGVGWFSAVLVLAPLLVARWALVQYGEEFRSHERTLNALVLAVETKDTRSQGHSGRVAQLCEWTAESLGLGYQDVQHIRTAGMLHDVGKIAIPSRILAPRRPLTPQEQDVLCDHALQGVSLLAGITFLEQSLDGVAHHHERVDGRGYPHGLAGEAIPLAARIVAVADAFDALTTERPYRPALGVEEALVELDRRAGSQLDPDAVDALRRAVRRHTWAVTHLATRPGDRSHQVDHDDPEFSDLIARRSRPGVGGAFPAAPTGSAS